jgi:hypothetical protein
MMVQLNLKKSELLGYFTFNSTYWDNDGPAKPFEKNKLLGYFLSTILLVRGIMMNVTKPAAPEKQTVGILSTFNTSTWDNDGTANLQHQKK